MEAIRGWIPQSLRRQAWRMAVAQDEFQIQGSRLFIPASARTRSLVLDEYEPAVTACGAPPVLVLPRQDTRNHSRSILVSQLSGVERATEISRVTEFHSPSVGTAEREAGMSAGSPSLPRAGCAGWAGAAAGVG